MTARLGNFLALMTMIDDLCCTSCVVLFKTSDIRCISEASERSIIDERSSAKSLASEGFLWVMSRALVA